MRGRRIRDSIIGPGAEGILVPLATSDHEQEGPSTAQSEGRREREYGRDLATPWADGSDRRRDLR